MFDMNRNYRLNVPDPVIDNREADLLDVLTERYSKLIEPSKVTSAIKKAGAKVGDIVPEKLKSYGN